MYIDADFDGGSIVVIAADDPEAIKLALRHDSAAEFMQWFYFRLSGAQGTPCQLHIINASEATYQEGWQAYRACASYDEQHWFRVPTEYDGEMLTIHHRPESDTVYYAYFTPYAMRRHAALIARAATSRRAKVVQVCETVEKRPLQLVEVGDQDGTKCRIWIIARQHPGETMTAFFMEGLIDRLLNENDAVAQALLEKAVFYLIPNMNPDGSVLGNLRTNAAGSNLNRAWLTPSTDESPEVFFVRQSMIKTGVDMFLDVHGDEGLPYVFAAPCEGNPSYSERIKELEHQFMNSLVEANQHFQREHGYKRFDPGRGDLRIAACYVGERFDCLSLTLEMPFKDDANHPDELLGWSAERSIDLGRCTLQSTLACVDSLR